LACSLSVDGNAGKVFATLVYGNLYRIEKKKLSIGKLSSLTRSVIVAEASALTSGSKEESKGGAADYHVASIEQEDVPMTAVTA